mmetsp:Transcript_32821/g.106078  ORF Transcript_32821/g.106078 Transcript_32821/m.106078 type:complete len:247 (-) Transcript_32821:2245-2985(-)
MTLLIHTLRCETWEPSHCLCVRTLRGKSTPPSSCAVSGINWPLRPSSSVRPCKPRRPRPRCARRRRSRRSWSSSSSRRWSRRLGRRCWSRLAWRRRRRRAATRMNYGVPSLRTRGSKSRRRRAGTARQCSCRCSARPRFWPASRPRRSSTPAARRWSSTCAGPRSRRRSSGSRRRRRLRAGRRRRSPASRRRSKSRSGPCRCCLPQTRRGLAPRSSRSCRAAGVARRPTAWPSCPAGTAGSTRTGV